MTIPEAEQAGDAVFYHGGNLAAARARYPDAPAPWIDLSTGINPVSYPVGHIPDTAWTRLPEGGGIARLESAAALAYGGADPACVVAAPGTQALIQLLPRLWPARRVGILGFTYGEHAQCWSRTDAHVETVEQASDLEKFDVAVVVNPNNPDGRIVPPEVLAKLAETLARSGGLLVVDEAFMDVMPHGLSLAGKPPPATVVLRSFGKTYGLAGLRLGFAVADQPHASRIRAELGPWAISGPAVHIGEAALRDGAWLEETTARLTRDSLRLDRMMLAAGFDPAGGTPLFRLYRHARAFEIFDALGQRGVLARAFAGRPEWLRLGLPAGEDQWSLFADRLASACA